MRHCVLLLILTILSVLVSVTPSSSSRDQLQQLVSVDRQLAASWKSVSDDSVLPPLKTRISDNGGVRVVYDGDPSRRLLLVTVDKKDNNSSSGSGGSADREQQCQRFVLLWLDPSTGAVKMDPVDVKIGSDASVECFSRVEKVDYMVDNVSSRRIRLVIAARLPNAPSDKLRVYHSTQWFYLARDSSSAEPPQIQLKSLGEVAEYRPAVDNMVSLDRKRILFTALDSDGHAMLFQWKQRDSDSLPPSMVFNSETAIGENVDRDTTIRIVLPFHYSSHSYLSFFLETRRSSGSTEIAIYGKTEEQDNWDTVKVPLDLAPLSPLDDTSLQCNDETSRCSFFFVAGKFIFTTSPNAPVAVNVFELDITEPTNEFEQWPTRFAAEKPFFWSVVRSGDTRSIVTIDVTATRAVKSTRKMDIANPFIVNPGNNDNDIVISSLSDAILYRVVYEMSDSPRLYTLLRTDKDDDGDGKPVFAALDAIPDSRHILFSQITSSQDKIATLNTVRWLDANGEYDEAKQLISARDGALASLSIDSVLQLRPTGQKDSPPRLVVFITFSTKGEPDVLKSVVLELTLNMVGQCWPACVQGSNSFCSNEGACECYNDGDNGYWTLAEDGKCVCANSNVIGDRCTRCKEGFTGAACRQEVQCFGVPYRSSNACSGNGRCSISGSCVCSENYFGNNCNTTSCFDILSSSELVCNGRGRCTQFDKCECLTGYGGPDCRVSAIASGETFLVVLAIGGTASVILFSVVVTSLVVMYRRGISVQEAVDIIKKPGLMATMINMTGRRQRGTADGFHEMLDDDDAGSFGGVHEESIGEILQLSESEDDDDDDGNFDHDSGDDDGDVEIRFSD